MTAHGQREPGGPLKNTQSVLRNGQERQWRVLLFLLGLELPLLGGFWVWNNDPWNYLMLLTVLVGAFLLRSWWALLIVPVVFAIGIAFGILLFPLLQGGWPALEDRLNRGLEGVDILLFLGTPVVIALTALGASVGVALGKWR